MDDGRFQGIPQLPRVAMGDRPSAAAHNAICDAIERLYMLNPGAAPSPAIEVARLTEPIGPVVADKDQFYDTKARVRFHNSDIPNDALGSDLGAHEWESVTTPARTVCDQDEIVGLFHHKQSGKTIPLNTRYYRWAITYPHKDASGNKVYPSSDANVFGIKFVRISYVESPGRRQFSISYLDSGAAAPANDEPDAYVLNAYDEACANQAGGTDASSVYESIINPCRENTAYVPAYTVIPVWDQIGLGGLNQFFTYICCAFPYEESSISSQGSSVSFSSVSDSSVSQSSQGSSLSSSFSSRGSSLSSDQSSLSSGGSSLSSGGSSISPSGNSSLSISESGPCAGTEVTLVSSLQFDDASCVLTVCTRTICFTPDAIQYITGEHC